MKNLILTLVLMSWTIPALSETKLGYVDVQRAVQSVSSGKKAKESMEAEFKKRKDSLDKKKSDIEKMGQDLEKKKSVLSEEVFGKKQMELQEEMMRFQKTVAENQMEIQKKEKDLLEPIFEKMKKIIEKVAQEKNFTMVIEKNAQNVLFAQKDTDLTDDVIKAFEKEK
jgi:outer membrane protein